MTDKEAIAYFKGCNERLISVAKDKNVYDYEEQVIEAYHMRRTFEANEKAIQALEQQPKGKWIERWCEWQQYIECSECGYETGLRCNTNFCPNCGADMRGDCK